MIPQSLPSRLLALHVRLDAKLGAGFIDDVTSEELTALTEAAAALSGREAVAWLEPGTLNSARPEDFAECSAKWPNDYKHWFPVFTTPQPGGGMVLVPEVSTVAMDDAGASTVGHRISSDEAEDVWNAMLAAAPSAKGGAE